jgi:hypothetical protein
MTVTTDRTRAGAHVVFFYESGEQLERAVSRYLGDSLRDNESVVVVATPAHADAFARRLVETGLDVEQARNEGRYVALDAAQTLASFLVDHRPRPELFNSIVGDIVRRAAKDGRRIRVYGEMVALLWEAGQLTAAMELESLWNGLGTRLPFSLFCAYPATSIGPDAPALEHLCGLHSAVIGRLPGSLPCPSIHVEVATRRYSGARLDPRDARRFTVDALSSCGWGRIADDAAIVVAELAANAVAHAHSPFTVTLSSRGDGVKIAVRDESPLAPNLRHPASIEVRGRGLRLVAALSTSWGADLEDDGKVVWAELVP